MNFEKRVTGSRIHTMFSFMAEMISPPVEKKLRGPPLDFPADSFPSGPKFSSSSNSNRSQSSGGRGIGRGRQEKTKGVHDMTYKISSQESQYSSVLFYILGFSISLHALTLLNIQQKNGMS